MVSILWHAGSYPYICMHMGHTPDLYFREMKIPACHTSHEFMGYNLPPKKNICYAPQARLSNYSMWANFKIFKLDSLVKGQNWPQAPLIRLNTIWRNNLYMLCIMLPLPRTLRPVSDVLPRTFMSYCTSAPSYLHSSTTVCHVLIKSFSSDIC